MQLKVQNMYIVRIEIKVFVHRKFPHLNFKMTHNFIVNLVLHHADVGFLQDVSCHFRRLIKCLTVGAPGCRLRRSCDTSRDNWGRTDTDVKSTEEDFNDF